MTEYIISTQYLYDPWVSVDVNVVGMLAHKLTHCVCLCLFVCSSVARTVLPNITACLSDSGSIVFDLWDRAWCVGWSPTSRRWLAAFFMASVFHGDGNGRHLWPSIRNEENGWVR